jgi:Tfp pilus assembly protein PilZ
MAIMANNKSNSVERRKYIRLEAPVGLSYICAPAGKMHSADTKNISAEGISFQATDKTLDTNDMVELKLSVPDAPNPVHVKGKVVWREKITLEDNSPFDFGVEFIEIEEDNKNTFLKFLCDLIYNIPEDK